MVVLVFPALDLLPIVKKCVMILLPIVKSNLSLTVFRSESGWWNMLTLFLTGKGNQLVSNKILQEITSQSKLRQLLKTLLKVVTNDPHQM